MIAIVPCTAGRQVGRKDLAGRQRVHRYLVCRYAASRVFYASCLARRKTPRCDAHIHMDHLTRSPTHLQVHPYRAQMCAEYGWLFIHFCFSGPDGTRCADSRQCNDGSGGAYLPTATLDPGSASLQSACLPIVCQPPVQDMG